MLEITDTPSLLISLSGLSWTLAYVAYIRQAHRDRTVGMPLPSLLLNITWEVLYGLLLPSDLLGRIVMLSWLAIDCVIVRCALAYDRIAYGQPVRDHFGSLLVAGAAIAFLANALFPYSFWDTTECTITHGMLLQVGLPPFGTFAPDDSLDTDTHARRSSCRGPRSYTFYLTPRRADTRSPSGLSASWARCLPLCLPSCTILPSQSTTRARSAGL